ncbi:MAG: LD-carboxypeptidase [Sphingobacteriales bacterium]|nr:LD-carboxypeptidase [Sphingobacteriales bacterium]
MKFPPYLQKGDTIGITCPAGYMAKEKAQTCIDTLQQWGYEVMVGKTLGSQSNNYFSGTDEQRLNELQAMLDDDSINAILCARGGYGVGRIIDQLDFTKFKRKPKWIIGFSDITVLHAHLNKLKIESLHAPMASAFNDNEFVQSLKKALVGKQAKYKCAPHLFNKPGEVTGELVGGNLSLLVNVIGTPSDINTRNKILFIEDIGEYIYSVDRMFYQLNLSGNLDNLKGLIIVGFSGMKVTERPFGKTVYEAINAIVKDYGFPICFNFPVSHENENYALKVGGNYTLKVANKAVVLTESV